MRKFVLVFIVAVVMTAAVYGYYYYKRPQAPALMKAGNDSSSQVTIDDLDVRLLELGGPTKRISEYSEGVLFLNFWATWCGYCEMEMPDLISIDRRMQAEGIGRVVTIDVNEKEAVVKEYLEKKGFTSLTVLLDTNGEAARKFDIQGYPTTFAFKDGVLVDYHVGMMRLSEMEAMLERAR